MGGYGSTALEDGLRSSFALVVALVVCLSAGAVGGLATGTAPEFYDSLVRPGWAPPASLFGPVWTVLYSLMAVAAWLVWNERGLADAGFALGLFAAQLVLNAIWSWLFFRWRLGTVAAVEIVVLLVFIAWTALAFWRVRPLAGSLMFPYLAWVGYATALTFSLVRQNPSAFG